jgi:ubiquitin C-terminal hydrolase
MLGFRNLGNTCYMNSVMSVFLNSPNFIDLLNTTKEKENDISPREKAAVELLKSFR